MLRDGVSGDWIGTFAGHKGAVWSCKLDPTGNLAATASGDFSVSVWDAITGQALFTNNNAKSKSSKGSVFQHDHIVKTCDFSPDSQLLATGGHEGILRIYDLTKAPNIKAPIKIPQPTTDTDSKKKVYINKCCWVSNTTILTGCTDGKIRIWEIQRSSSGPQVPSAPSHTLETDGAEIRDLEVKRIDSGAIILTVAAGQKVYFFDLQSFAKIHVYDMPIHFRDEGGASLHPSGKRFIAGGSDLWVRVFDFETGEEVECLKGHHGPIRCLRYSPDGTRYASGSEDGTIRLWKS